VRMRELDVLSAVIGRQAIVSLLAYELKMSETLSFPAPPCLLCPLCFLADLSPTLPPEPRSERASEGGHRGRVALLRAGGRDEMRKEKRERKSLENESLCGV
jgi:hypothetical protein